MVVIELSYKASVEKGIQAADQCMDGHLAFLKKYYDQGVFVVSGPKRPREGGVIIANTDKMTAEALIQDDTFYQENICTYRVIEFAAVKVCDALSTYQEVF